MDNFISSEIQSLPPLPQTITELQSICANEDTTIKQVSNVIEKDPFLTADLIKYANSPIYGYQRSVNSVFQAVSMFGISTAKGLAIASAIKSNFVIDLSPYSLTTSEFIEVSNLKSAFILQWYQAQKHLHGVLVPYALVMHIGMAIIADSLRKKGEVKEFMRKFNQDDFFSSEINFFSCTHLEVLEYLFEHWNFEENMIKVVHHLSLNKIPKELETYILPLKVLNVLINPFEIATQEQIKSALNLIESYQLDKEGFISTLQNMHLITELDLMEIVGVDNLEHK